MTIKRWAIVSCLVVAAGCGRGAATDPDGFAGTWVLSVNQRVLMVMTLERDRGTYTGTWQHPKQFSTDGLAFSGIGSEVTTETISRASSDGNTLLFATRDPDDAADETEFQMTKLDEDAASLAINGVPFEPWLFVRHQEGPPEVFRGWDAGRSYEIERSWVPSNEEMRQIAEADQADRASGMLTPATDAADAERRRQTLALLQQGLLRSGEDFRNAALVFQHGRTSDDFLLAHTFALAALAKGDATASWLAAATLDRYLHVLGQPQIYGTQFAEGTLSQEPFTSTLVADSLRVILRVPPIAQQRQAFEEAMRALTMPGQN